MSTRMCDHRVQKAVDPLAELRNVAALAFKRNALGQVIALDRGHDLLGLLHGLHRGGDVGGVFDDLERLAVGIQDRIVAGLNPDLLAALAEALVLVGVELAASELVPEHPILGALRVGRVDEHAVMLPLISSSE